MTVQDPVTDDFYYTFLDSMRHYLILAIQHLNCAVAENQSKE
jgi:hypothetical protein